MALKRMGIVDNYEVRNFLCYDCLSFTKKLFSSFTININLSSQNCLTYHLPNYLLSNISKNVDFSLF